MEFTLAEKKVLSVAAVLGNVNRREFNTACNTSELHKKARDRALDSLREKKLINKHAFRNVAEEYDGFTTLDDNKGIVSVDNIGYSSKVTVQTHPFAHQPLAHD